MINLLISAGHSQNTGAKTKQGTFEGNLCIERVEYLSKHLKTFSNIHIDFEYSKLSTLRVLLKWLTKRIKYRYVIELHYDSAINENIQRTSVFIQNRTNSERSILALSLCELTKKHIGYAEAVVKTPRESQHPKGLGLLNAAPNDCRFIYECSFITNEQHKLFTNEKFALIMNDWITIIDDTLFT